MFNDSSQKQGATPATSTAAANDTQTAEEANLPTGAPTPTTQSPAADPGSVFPPSQDPEMAGDPFGTTAQPATPQEPAQNDDQQQEEAVSLPEPEDPATDDSTEPATDDGLTHIKKQALQMLSPLVQHLDQSPEEKFKTTMMMIQASDNKDLVPVAYDAANSIKDDKTRAQALLDIINEINYFTQNNL